MGFFDPPMQQSTTSSALVGHLLECPTESVELRYLCFCDQLLSGHLPIGGHERIRCLF